MSKNHYGKRKSWKKQKPHDKQHREATADPEVRQQITILRHDWRAIRAVERGDRILLLLDKHCTIRGLSRDLHVSSKGIRFAIDAAHLPDEKRAAIQQGASAKRILAQARAEHWPNPAELRRQQERETGGPSTWLANMIAWFVITQFPSVWWFDNTESFFHHTKEEMGVHFLRPSQGFSTYNYHPETIGPNCSLKRAVQMVWQNKPEEDWSPTEVLIEALVSFIIIMEPDRFVRYKGFEKARKMLVRLQPTAEETELLSQQAWALGPRAFGKLLRQMPEPLYRPTRGRPRLLPVEV